MPFAEMKLSKLERKLFAEGVRGAIPCLLPADWNPVTQNLSRTLSLPVLSVYYGVLGLNIGYSAHLVWVGWPYTAADTRQLFGQLRIFSHVTLIFSVGVALCGWLIVRPRVEEFLTFANILGNSLSSRGRRLGVQEKCLWLVVSTLSV